MSIFSSPRGSWTDSVSSLSDSSPISPSSDPSRPEPRALGGRPRLLPPRAPPPRPPPFLWERFTGGGFSSPSSAAASPCSPFPASEPSSSPSWPLSLAPVSSSSASSPWFSPPSSSSPDPSPVLDRFERDAALEAPLRFLVLEREPLFDGGTCLVLREPLRSALGSSSPDPSSSSPLPEPSSPSPPDSSSPSETSSDAGLSRSEGLDPPLPRPLPRPRPRPEDAPGAS